MKTLNIKLVISYEGTNYSGFQSQKKENTVANQLKKAIQIITDVEDMKIYCAGRTDAGVHALGQVINFFTEKTNLNEDNWIKALNSYLPKDIRILSCEFAAHGFNARKSAYSREYWYKLINSPVISALDYKFSGHYINPLNIELLNKYCSYLIGEHDFTSFCSSIDTSKTKYRYIHSVKIEKHGDMIIFKIIGNAFLHKMIRTIIGTLLKLHKEKKEPETMKQIIEAKNRKLAGPTFSAKGLIFYKVYYTDDFIK